MQNGQHQNLVGFIWNIANKLRGPYRPPQYRRVMLPMVVLRRFDLVLAENKQKVLDEKKRLERKGIKGPALDKALSRIAANERKQELYNASGFTFEKLLGDAPNIAGNLIAYIQGFSPRARDIFDKFDFEAEIAKLDEANRLFLIVKEFCSPDIDLSPESRSNPKGLSNLQMGYLFEELVRKFNEQANEEAGDHFTPREVIRLMVQLIFTGEDDIYKKGISRSVYDPTAGTGGMLSEAEKFIKGDGHSSGLNPDANIELFGQEYNPEAYAICCSDLLIKDAPISNLIYGDTLGVKDAKNKTNGFVAHDGHQGKTFHYMLSNPPYGVEWKPEEDFVREEFKEQGFKGRFGAGLPRINDGSLLFLQHMISKRKPSPRKGGDGSKIAIVFNGSPLFTGDAGSGESNIRRWIIERDMLDAVVALPDQMFYNTGIYTYIWLVTNKKSAHRQGKVQLIDGTRHFKKMDKSLGNKRNELSDDHIRELVRLYAEHQQDAESEFLSDSDPKNPKQKRICSKLFENREFGFLKVTVERPLRLNFQTSPERIARLDGQPGFINLATSKKRKNEAAYKKEIKEGEKLQAAIKTALEELDSERVYRSRPEFEEDLKAAMKIAGVRLDSTVRKAILAAVSERDPKAEICIDAKGNREPDPELRDTEIVPLPADINLPLPLGYDNETGLDKLLALVEDHCEEYLLQEVIPHVSDAWIDHRKTKVGYEIPLTRHFYVYEPPRPLEVIAAEIGGLEKDIVRMLGEIAQ